MQLVGVFARVSRENGIAGGSPYSPQSRCYRAVRSARDVSRNRKKETSDKMESTFGASVA